MTPRTRSLCSLVFLVLALVLLAHSRGDARTNPGRPVSTAVTPPERGRIVFLARYYRTRGPCLRIGKGWAMPVVDAFEVVQVVKGKLPASFIKVRLHTGGGEAYPRHLTPGKLYTLRLTPSATTRQRLRANEKEGFSSVWVDGDEIEDQRKDD
jgi:hypothetical protein